MWAGSEDDPRATLLVEPDAGIRVIRVGPEGAESTPLGLSTRGYPFRGRVTGLGRLPFEGKVRKDSTHLYGETPMPDGSGTWIGPHDDRGLPQGSGTYRPAGGGDRVLTAVAEHGSVKRPD